MQKHNIIFNDSNALAFILDMPIYIIGRIYYKPKELYVYKDL